jgi:WD40 repeat protein
MHRFRELAATAAALAISSMEMVPAQAAPLPPSKSFGTPVRMLDGLPIDAIFSRDGALLLTSCLGSMTQVWDARTGKRLAMLKGKGLAGGAFFCGPQQERIVVGFKDDGVRAFDARTGKK